MINALRGMKDTISPTSEIYAHIIETCTKIAQNYGFSFIETPILEDIATLTHAALKECGLF